MMTLLELATLCGGRWTCNEGARFTGVSTDTRIIRLGELFVALRGENFDGHDFALNALKQGAAAALVDESWISSQDAASLQGMSFVAVADTRLALGALAAHWRRRFDIPLIGVTGSNGKTTVKEMCAAILREQMRREHHDESAEGAVLATTGNLNNDIGLPLMLLRLREHHRVAVIEMGMNHVGEIDYLTRIAAPTIALVNNAQRAHLEGLGSLAAVARAKGEIFNGLNEVTSEGVAIINADDAQAPLWHEMATSAGVRHRVDFGFASSARIHADWQPRAYGSWVRITTPQGSCEIELQIPGQHNVSNALAATAATLAAGASLQDVASGLAGYTGIKGRLQRRPAERGAWLIDDSYNANPDSMRAAIDVLAAIPGYKIFVLGDMGEVGEQAGQFHDELGGYAKSMGVDRLLALGDHSMAAVRNFGEGAQHFRDTAKLIESLRLLLNEKTTVLIKGSRFMRMERIAEAIESKT